MLMVALKEGGPRTFVVCMRYWPHLHHERVLCFDDTVGSDCAGFVRPLGGQASEQQAPTCCPTVCYMPLFG